MTQPRPDPLSRTAWILIIIGLIAFFVLLWHYPAKAQAVNDLQTLTISKVKGLWTLGGVVGVEPDYASVSNNVDFQRFGLNTIGMRKDYDSVSFWPGTDSILGIFPLQMADGRRRLIGVRDDSAKSYGSVWATPWGSANFDSATKIQDYWGATGIPSATVFRDAIYLVNGEQKGMVYDGNVSRSFPLQAPGEPTMVPLNSVGTMNGEYRYMFTGTIFKSSSNETIFDGYVSGPVRVHNGQVLLKDFSYCGNDSTITGALDSVKLYVYRTRGNVGLLDDLDTFFLVSQTAYVIKSTAGAFTGVTFTDTTSDANLYTSSTRTWPSIVMKLGRDSTTMAISRRYGSPSFISSDTAAGDTTQGIWRGMTGQKDTSGVVYACSYVDTLTGLESDTGRSLWVYYNDSTPPHSLFKKITIGLPKSPANVTGLALNIYRGTMVPFGRIDSTKKTVLEYLRNAGRSWWTFSKARVDSIVVLDLYQVGQVKPSDTIFADTMRTDSAIARFHRFNQQQPPNLMTQIFTSQNQLCGIQDSRFVRSRVDSVTKWMTFEFSDLSPNDGDKLVTAWPTRYDQVRAMKNFTNWNMNSDTWKPSLYGNWGCVAPRSHVASAVGDWYMSARGFILENSGPTLERTYESPVVSNTLNNFTKMTLAQLSTAFSTYLPKEDLFLSSIGDTTYACFPKAGFSWATWTDLTFAGACIYDTGNTVGLKPSETMYFFKRGGQTLYRYGSTNTGSLITYQTVPLFTDHNLDQVMAIGIGASGTVGGADMITGRLYDERGYNVGSVQVFDSLTVGFPGSMAGIGYCYKDWDASPAKMVSFRLYTTLPTTQFIRGGIEQIEIIYRKAVERQGYR